MHKVVISLFPLVGDIDQLERILFLLKQNSIWIDRSKFHITLDVVYPLGDYFTDWNKSILKKDFFKNKFENLKPYTDWADEVNFQEDELYKGCVDYIHDIFNMQEVDDFIMLDTDAVFNQYTISTLLEASLEAKQNGDKYIITPEYIKLWDSTWDVLCNEKFKDKPYGYELISDPIIDSAPQEDIILEPINEFKFGGGWCTLISKPLVDAIKIPKDAVGYSPIDTFIMYCAAKIQGAIQYKVKNLVVCEDKKYLTRHNYKGYIVPKDVKNEYFQSTWEKLMKRYENI